MRNFSDEQFILFFANQHRELFNEIAGDFHEFAYKGEGGKYPEAGGRRSKKHQRYERGTVSRENPARGSRPDVSLSTHRREGRQGAYHYPSMMQEFAVDPTQSGLDRIRKLDRYENPIREKTHDLHKGGVDPESHKPSIEEQQKRLDWSKIPKPGKKDMSEFYDFARQAKDEDWNPPGPPDWDEVDDHAGVFDVPLDKMKKKHKREWLIHNQKGYTPELAAKAKARYEKKRGGFIPRNRIQPGPGGTGLSEFSHLNEFAKAKDFMKDYAKAVAGHQSDTRFERAATKKRITREATQKAVGDMSSGKLPGKKTAPFGYGIKNLNEFDCKRRVALGRKMLRFMEGSYA